MADTALRRAYRRRLNLIRDRTTAMVVAADVSDATEFVNNVVPMVLRAQTSAVVETDVFMSTEAGLATGTSTEPWGLDADELIGVKARRGDFLEDVYGRNHRSSAGTFAGRMAREVVTDITLAERGATFVHTAGDDRIAGYRRVLQAGKNCALCVVAASVDYKKSDLRPIHLHCRCETQTVYKDAPAWRKPSNDQLRELYARAGGTDKISLSRIRLDASELPDVDIVATNLGPTLVQAAA